MADEKRHEVPAEEEKLSGADAFKVDLYFWLQALVAVVVGLILVFTFVGRIIGVVGSSMVPTLHNGDMLILQSIGYEPRQGDVVVLTKEFGSVEGPIVKRVIATGGQTVEVDYAAGVVRVDGQVLLEPYRNGPMERPRDPYRTIEAVTVPEGSLFVLGDNRNESGDSRDWRLGTIDERYVMGQVVWVLAPPGRFGAVG